MRVLRLSGSALCGPASLPAFVLWPGPVLLSAGPVACPPPPRVPVRLWAPQPLHASRVLPCCVLAARRRAVRVGKRLAVRCRSAVRALSVRWGALLRPNGLATRRVGCRNGFGARCGFGVSRPNGRAPSLTVGRGTPPLFVRPRTA